MTPTKSKTTRKLSLAERLLQPIASLRITVACLFLFFVLTFWGTVYQTHAGLFEAQERFFNSFYFLIGGVVPFPGGQLVLWILFFNLLAAAVVRFRLGKTRPGILVIHTGVLFFLVASFVTFHAAEEGNVSLKEGEGTNLAVAYHDWELAVWDKSGEVRSGPDANGAFHLQRRVSAYPIRQLRRGEILDFSEHEFKARVEFYYKNSDAFVQHDGAYDPAPLNRSGIRYLAPTKAAKEPEKNLPGLMIMVLPDQGTPQTVLLFGGEAAPVDLSIGEKALALQLRRKSMPLPFLMELVDFKRVLHSGTEIAKSFESRVTIHPAGGERQAHISMNEPLRYENFTFYQASYAMGEGGEEFSTLAVVKNAGRLLPYIASFWVFFGFLMHFGQRLSLAIQKRKK